MVGGAGGNATLNTVAAMSTELLEDHKVLRASYFRELPLKQACVCDRRELEALEKCLANL
jgi:hypothetical protein